MSRMHQVEEIDSMQLTGYKPPAACKGLLGTRYHRHGKVNVDL